MRSKAVAHLLAGLRVMKTNNWPHVPDDNPFSESQFKTLKYRPDFPQRFGRIQDERSFGRVFFPWYNGEHYHSALGLLTPQVVHYGGAERVIDGRKSVLLEAYRVHPERFVRKPPQPQAVPQAVWINPPEKLERRPELDTKFEKKLSRNY